MNTCLEIKFKGDLCCFCNSLNQQSCQICKVVIDFVGFEHESTKNTMNIDFKKNTNLDFTLTCAECFILISRLSVVF